MTDEPEPPHDVLAADEFSVPSGDPTLAHGPADVPEAPFAEGDPPHDVLAAEEFAMPAGPVADHEAPPAVPGRRRGRLLAAVALGAIAAIVLRRRS